MWASVPLLGPPRHTHGPAPPSASQRRGLTHEEVWEIGGYFTRQVMTTREFRIFMGLVVFWQCKGIKLDMPRKMSSSFFLPFFRTSFLLSLSSSLKDFVKISNTYLWISFTAAQICAFRQVQHKPTWTLILPDPLSKIKQTVATSFRGAWYIRQSTNGQTVPLLSVLSSRAFQDCGLAVWPLANGATANEASKLLETWGWFSCCPLKPQGHHVKKPWRVCHGVGSHLGWHWAQRRRTRPFLFIPCSQTNSDLVCCPAYPQNCEKWFTVLSYWVLGWLVTWQKLCNRPEPSALLFFSCKLYCKGHSSLNTRHCLDLGLLTITQWQLSLSD